MKKTAILCSLVVIFASANAQEEINPKPETDPKKKNEISINTAPVFRTLLNSGSSEATRFSATYKRYLTCQSALRLSIMADMIHNDNLYMNPWNEVIILQTDSVMIKQNIVSPGYVSPHINIGYERLFGKRKLKWFYGTDLSVGYAKSHSYTENKILFRDTTQGPNAWVEAQTFQAEIVSKTNKKIFSIGMSPFFGAKYPLSKRFSVSAQVGCDMTYQTQKVTNSQSNVSKTNTISTFDFNLSTGIVNDISLIYKF